MTVRPSATRRAARGRPMQPVTPTTTTRLTIAPSLKVDEPVVAAVSPLVEQESPPLGSKERFTRELPVQQFRSLALVPERLDADPGGAACHALPFLQRRLELRRRQIVKGIERDHE